MTMELIETKTLETAAASIEFTSIPQDGTDLVLLTSARTNRAETGDLLGCNLNGVSTNQSSRIIEGSGSGVGSSSLTTLRVANATGANATSNTFGNSIAYFSNYSGNTAKSISVDAVSENNATASGQFIVANLWNSTAAITSITVLSVNSANLQAGTTISLYKVTKGSDGIVTTS
jgi:hypothetical protein